MVRAARALDPRRCSVAALTGRLRALDLGPVGYAELLPAPALRPLVACTWAISGVGSTHRVLPDGCIDVLVFGNTSKRPARAVGTMRRAVVIPPHDGSVIGIRFRPGEAPRLLPAAARELTDSDAPLDTLWGDDGRALEEALVGLVEEIDRVGIPPKFFARVMRLQRAAALLFESTAPSEAALLAGYADQAHFTR